MSAELPPEIRPEVGDVYGPYEVVAVYSVTMRYRFVTGGGTWKTRIREFENWVEMQDFRPRCRATQESTHEHRNV